MEGAFPGLLCALLFEPSPENCSAEARERRSCRIRRNQREREAFLFPLSETNLKHLFWRRLLLSFSFKVLTKKGDGINSSWLSSGNPGLLWDGGTGKIKERQK